ncbi:MAG: DJ-1/PfpI family protein [Saprospiraceae bacterium]
MKIAFIIFNGITWLDFVGVYDPISRLKSLNYLPDLTWDICSFTDTVCDNFGLEIKPTKIKESLASYDVIIVPGGLGTRELQANKEFIDWIKTSNEESFKISISTGSLILGAAGFLNNKKATTNYSVYETLEPHCIEVVRERIVEDENIITAGAVSASIDLGLYLCKKWAGQEAEVEIRTRMDYHG